MENPTRKYICWWGIAVCRVLYRSLENIEVNVATAVKSESYNKLSLQRTEASCSQRGSYTAMCQWKQHAPENQMTSKDITSGGVDMTTLLPEMCLRFNLNESKPRMGDGRDDVQVSLLMHYHYYKSCTHAHPCTHSQIHMATWKWKVVTQMFTSKRGLVFWLMHVAFFIWNVHAYLGIKNTDRID